MAWTKETKATNGWTKLDKASGAAQGFLSGVGFLVQGFLESGTNVWTKETKATNGWTKETKATP